MGRKKAPLRPWKRGYAVASTFMTTLLTLILILAAILSVSMVKENDVLLPIVVVLGPCFSFSCICAAILLLRRQREKTPQKQA